MFKLIVNPLCPGISWEEFCARTPTSSIALDGYVREPSRFDPAGPRANFNHHDGCDRLATRATCGQVLLALRQGLTDVFDQESFVFVNDCDEDVCLSWYLLKESAYYSRDVAPMLSRLVHVEDYLDTTAGSYPHPANAEIMQEIAWIFDPYRRFRASGQLDQRNADAFCAVIDDVCLRIGKHLVGRGCQLPLDTRFEVEDFIAPVSFVREVGLHARAGMAARGLRAFVSTRMTPSGAWVHTLGRASPFVPFDIPAAVEALNAIEPGWGGGNLVAGSPRTTGSKISPAKLKEIVRASVRQSRSP